MKAWLLEKRWRTILAGIFIVAIPLLTLSAYIYFGLTSVLEERLLKENQRLAQFTAHTLEEKLRSEISFSTSFTSRYLLQEGLDKRDEKEMLRHLKTLIETSITIERAFITDRAGVQLANWPYTPETVGKDFSDRDWYKGVSKNWSPYVSEFYMRTARPQRYLFAIAVPMKYKANIIGILVMQPRNDFIKKAVSGLDVAEEFKDHIHKGHIYVVDAKGHLVYHPDFTMDRLIDFSKVPPVRNVLKGMEGIEKIIGPVHKLPVLAAYHPVQQGGWGVVVEQRIDVVLAPLNKITFWLIAITGLMLLAGGYFAFRWSEMMFALRKLSGELEQRVGERTAELAKTNRVLKTLSECNQMLVRANNEESLIKEICRIITEFGGYRMALAGYPEQDEKKTVRVVAQAGYEKDFIENVKLTWADTEPGKGPIGTTVRCRSISVFKNIASGQYPAAWREAALKRGYCSAIGLPLLSGQELLGALAIYSSEAEAFDDREIGLLKELADDMAYGITALRTSIAHQRAEEALHKSYELYHSTLDNMMEGCQIIGSDWRYLYINDAAVRQSRCRRVDLLQHTMMEVYPGIEDSGLFAVLRRCMEERTAHIMENEFAFPDGSMGWFDLSIQPVPEGLFILSMDITVRKKAEEAAIARKAAEEASRAKSDFLANMSHELRTPLNSILGFSEVLQDELYGKLNEKQKEYVGDIYTSGEHLLDLINDILDLSKVEAGRMELEAGSFLLRDVLTASLTMFKEKAMKHGIMLNLKIEQDADIEIKADARKFKQIMFNLLSNAVKFTSDGGYVGVGARRVEILGSGVNSPEFDKPPFAKGGEGGFSNGQNFIEISVEDTGIGIKPEDIQKLFNEFTQLESTYIKQYEGTGLGLALTKMLVELHGGRIWAESEYGKGSRFAFVIPVEQNTASGIQESE